MRIVAAVGGVLAALIIISSAFAHAEPATIKPGNNAVVTTPPGSIEIETSQEMARQEGANDIDVFDANGTEVTTTSAVIDNGDRSHLSVAMPSNLAPGKYTVKWKTLSADDGDAANGEFSFTYDPNGTADAGTEVVRTNVVGAETGTAQPSIPATSSATAVGTTGGGDGGGTSWVLVTAVAVGMFVLGSGSTFLIVQRKP
jgi:methionine-rich copper-binding protein CopC